MTSYFMLLRSKSINHGNNQVIEIILLSISLKLKTFVWARLQAGSIGISTSPRLN